MRVRQWNSRQFPFSNMPTFCYRSRILVFDSLSKSSAVDFSHVLNSPSSGVCIDCKKKTANETRRKYLMSKSRCFFRKSRIPSPDERLEWNDADFCSETALWSPTETIALEAVEGPLARSIVVSLQSDPQRGKSSWILLIRFQVGLDHFEAIDLWQQETAAAGGFAQLHIGAWVCWLLDGLLHHIALILLQHWLSAELSQGHDKQEHGVCAWWQHAENLWASMIQSYNNAKQGS